MKPNNIAKPAIFFDRDDTLIRNVPYNGDPNLVELMPGAVQACQKLKQFRFELFVISNQSGVGRGLITVKDVAAVNNRMFELLGVELFTDVFCCYDAPNLSDTCRKPSPQMIYKAQETYNLDLTRSVMIGDKWSDVQAGQAAGCFTIYLNWGGTRDDLPNERNKATFVARDLMNAVDYVCKHVRSDP